LVDMLEMTRMSQPVVMHGPIGPDGMDLFPDKAGVSGWVPLIESGVQIHSIEPKHFITLDVYSCKKFDPKIVLEHARNFFGFRDYDHAFIVRGARYHAT